MLIEDFNRTIDVWITELEQYDFNSLCAKPSSDSWSLGQVYMHLIDETNFYIEQMKTCLGTNDNAAEEASTEAKSMFFNNNFPDEIIEGPPSNLYTPQPDNKEKLRSCLINLKNEIKVVEILMSTSSYKGKTKHPGLNYFSADEWLQFAEMHFRHHLRQKKRIDNFLKSKQI
ncbi:DinB family protein [Segetibacter koreensis]|uniref:DinB family protein n=1 Tax=Segetibacter koreensis TaxID=398037 RepID=UPI0003718154|nr:DinB family protein [Segetibacter koreensis]